MKPLATEKAVMKIEAENVLTFEFEKRMNKEQIKKEVEELFKVKVERVRTLIRDNKKLAYVKLNKKNLAIDVATKLGLM
jgi:ribosomal protein L23